MIAKVVNKEWGYEIWLANNLDENYCGKILYIKPGHSSSLHYHAEKHETFYILEGGLRVETINTETTEKNMTVLKEGDTMEIPRFLPHRLIPAGQKPVKFVEISTFHRDSDSYRIEK